MQAKTFWIFVGLVLMHAAATAAGVNIQVRGGGLCESYNKSSCNHVSIL
jgi:hypothetical protein